MKTETQDTLTSLNISVLASQKSYIERQASLAGFADPSDYLRQLIRAEGAAEGAGGAGRDAGQSD